MVVTIKTTTPKGRSRKTSFSQLWTPWFSYFLRICTVWGHVQPLQPSNKCWHTIATKLTKEASFSTLARGLESHNEIKRHRTLGIARSVCFLFAWGGRKTSSRSSSSKFSHLAQPETNYWHPCRCIQTFGGLLRRQRRDFHRAKVERESWCAVFFFLKSRLQSRSNYHHEVLHTYSACSWLQKVASDFLVFAQGLRLRAHGPGSFRKRSFSTLDT